MQTYHQLSPKDRFAILEVLAQYYAANDEKDIIAALAVCTSDATIEGDFTMRATHQRADLEKIYATEPGKKRHLMLNPIVLEASKNEVRLQHLMLVIEASVIPAAIATSKVIDVMRRTFRGWKIAMHRIEVDPSGKWMVQAAQKVQEVVENVKQRFE